MKNRYNYLLFFLLLWLSSTPTAHAQTNVLDSLDLVGIYNAIGGANWTRNDNWLTGTVDTWYGITVAGDRVTEIDLSSNNLVGVISSMDNLTALELLSFGENQVTALPSLDNLISLEYLYFHFNQVDSLPSLDNLVNLKELHCKTNGLTELPSLDNLVNLESLWVTSNPLEEFPNLDKLTNLRTLVSGGNKLEVFPSVDSLVNLQKFYPYYNFLDSLPNLDKLTDLTLLYTEFNELTFLPNLDSLTNLTQFRCNNNQLDFADIEPIFNYPFMPLSEFVYAPQDSVGMETCHALSTGDTDTLIIQTGGSMNQYQWMKDTVDIVGATDSIYVIASAIPTDAGEYVCRITSPLAPELTLYSHIQTVTVDIGLEQDSLVLVELYNATGGTSWTNQGNWLAGELSTWYGVTLGPGDCRVSGLDLSDNNLVGVLPDEINDLGGLEFLVVSNNQLTALPNLDDLTKLETLTCNYNLLDSLPNLDNLINLRSLRCGKNNIVELPSLDNLVFLENLYCFDNQLDSLPNLDSLANLISLNCYNNQIKVIPSLDNLTNLQDFRCFNNELSEIPNLDNNPLLHTISCGGNRAVTALPNLDNQINLQRLWFGYNNVDTLQNLDHMINLNWLQAMGNNLKELPNLDSLTNLQRLFCHQNELTELPPLDNLTNLYDIRCYLNQLDFGDMELIVNQPFMPLITFEYAPQDSVGMETCHALSTGDTDTLIIQTGGSMNQYQWMKDTVDIVGATDSIYVIASATPTDAGEYVCHITSPLAPELTLYSHIQAVTVDIGLEQDSLVLVELYNATDGTNWVNQDNWLTGELSTWYGVTLGPGDCRVSGLDLSDNNLVGMIPETFKELEAMESLILSRNQLTYLPSLGKMSKLERLACDYNQLPNLVGIDSLFNLEYLYCDHNELDSLSSLSNATYLRILECQNNNLQLLPSLGGLDSLEELHCSYNQLDSLPNLGDLSKLLVLQCRNNHLTELPSFDNLLSLRFLYCDSNQLARLPNLTNTTDLRWIECLGNQLDSLPALNHLSLFQRLQCSYNQLLALPNLDSLSNLKWLYCGGNQLNELPNLDNLTSLEAIECFSNQLDSLPSLDNLENLLSLNCSDNQLTSLPSLNTNTHLTRLYCYENQLTELPNLNNLVNLERIYAWENQLIALPNLSNQTNLTLLILANNELTELPSLNNLSSLEAVNCSGNYLTSLPNLENLPSLWYLNCDTNQITQLPNLNNVSTLQYLWCNDNQLTSLPNLDSLTNLLDFRCYGNQLDFVDITSIFDLPFMPITNFEYAPQDSIGTPTTQTIYTTLPHTLSVSTGDTANQYQWHKDGNPILAAIDSIYTIDSVMLNDAGTYICEITNPIVPGLTLYTHPAHRIVESDYVIVQDSLDNDTIYEYTVWEDLAHIVLADTVVVLDGANLVIDSIEVVIADSTTVIVVQDSSQLTLQYATLRPSNLDSIWQGIQVLDSATIAITDSTLIQNACKGVWVESSEPLSITNSTFVNNHIGISTQNAPSNTEVQGMMENIYNSTFEINESMPTFIEPSGAPITEFVAIQLNNRIMGIPPPIGDAPTTGMGGIVGNVFKDNTPDNRCVFSYGIQATNSGVLSWKNKFNKMYRAIDNWSPKRASLSVRDTIVNTTIKPCFPDFCQLQIANSQVPYVIAQDQIKGPWSLQDTISKRHLCFG